MTWKGVIFPAAALIALVVVVAAISYNAGRKSAQHTSDCSALTVTDTVWTVIHDTVFIETSRTLVRHDTVRLAAAKPLQIVTPCDTGTVSKTEAVDYNLK